MLTERRGRDVDFAESGFRPSVMGRSCQQIPSSTRSLPVSPLLVLAQLSGRRTVAEDNCHPRRNVWRYAKTAPASRRFVTQTRRLRPVARASQAERSNPAAAAQGPNPSKFSDSGDTIPAAISSFSPLARSSAHSSQTAHSRTKS